MTIKVQTFNCFGPAYGPRLVFRTKLLCDYLDEYSNSDIYFFQEVWKINHQKMLTNYFFRNKENYSFCHFDKLSPNRIRTGLMTCFKGKLCQSEYIPFKVNVNNMLDQIRSKVGVSKGIGYIKIADTSENYLHVLNIHTHPTSTNVRISQIIEIADRVASLTEDDIIIAGDFNMEPGSLEYRLFLSLTGCYVVPHKRYNHGDLVTYSRENPYAIPGLHKLVDFIFLKSRRLAFQESKINMKTYKGYSLSDHYGVEAKIIESSIGQQNNAEPKNLIQEVTVRLLKDKINDYSFAVDILNNLISIG